MSSKRKTRPGKAKARDARPPADERSILKPQPLRAAAQRFEIGDGKLTLLPDPRSLEDICQKAAADFEFDCPPEVVERVRESLREKYHFEYGHGPQPDGLRWKAVLAHRECLAALARELVPTDEKRSELLKCLREPNVEVVEDVTRSVVEQLRATGDLLRQGTWFLPDAWGPELTQSLYDRQLFRKNRELRECAKRITLDVVQHCMDVQEQGLIDEGVRPEIYAQALTLAVSRNKVNGKASKVLLDPDSRREAKPVENRPEASDPSTVDRDQAGI